MELLLLNWYSILMLALFIVYLISRLTPSEKDDKIVKTVIKVLIKLLTVVPDNKKGGGQFKIDVIEKELKNATKS